MGFNYVPPFFGRQMTRNISMSSVLFVVLHSWFAHVYLSVRMLAISFILTFIGSRHEAEILIQIRCLETKLANEIMNINSKLSQRLKPRRRITTKSQRTFKNHTIHRYVHVLINYIIVTFLSRFE